MDDLTGLTIDCFRITEPIGHGGMSSVYLAIDKELDRQVALKVPHTKYISDSGFSRRFMREAKAMARLRHVNIIQIYRIGSHGELPSFAMEYVDGESLSDLIEREGPLPVNVAVDYTIQIARALDHAHKKDVIHRDIKPANILIDFSEHTYVTDFGVSKILSDETTQQTIGVVGTPQYMSPEQCGAGQVDPRSDIYSLGVVFFEMLTGVPPFKGDTPAETMDKHVSKRPEFPDTFKEDLPQSIQSIIARMLEKDPDQRYQDIPALLEDLQSLKQEDTGSELDIPEPTASWDVGPEEGQDFILPAQRPHTRWPVFIFAGILIVCACLLAGSDILKSQGDLNPATIMHFLLGD